MSMPLAVTTLLIDGAEVDAGHVWTHAQDDPYPGGHRYRLWLPEPLASPWLSVGRGLSGLDTALASVRAAKQVQEIKTPRFVLNTIDSVTRGEQGVEIQGECSPHCSRLGCPYCGATVWVNWLFDHCARGADGSLLFRCKGCHEAAKVTLTDDIVSLVSTDGGRKSTCRQHALKHVLRDGLLAIALGKLKWEL
jgi:hypothetical protein